MNVSRELRRFTGVASLGENYLTWRELRRAAAGLAWLEVFLCSELEKALQVVLRVL